MNTAGPSKKVDSSTNYQLRATERAARKYLKAKGSCLWADWDLGSPDRFEEAVQWLVRVYESVNALQFAEVIAGVSEATQTQERPETLVRHPVEWFQP